MFLAETTEKEFLLQSVDPAHPDRCDIAEVRWFSLDDAYYALTNEEDKAFFTRDIIPRLRGR